ncbi:MAG: 50S ribosomal protein L4 [Clostridia bacterium]|nr:50S ribosomal protein L4 [Clostridia bacterium]
MPKISVLNMAGENVGELELSEAVFAIEPNEAAVHASVVNYLANQRQGTQSTLTRSGVSGGGKKPYRQKGTGRARQGSTRAPQFYHGGIALGPKPRSYRYAINRKVSRLAFKSVLSAKVRDEELIVIDELKTDSYSTKAVVAMLGAVKAAKKTLIVLESADEKFYRSARNIEGVKVAHAGAVCAYDLINCDSLILAKGAVAKFEEVYA